jgi:hypothetical protein
MARIRKTMLNWMVTSSLTSFALQLSNECMGYMREICMVLGNLDADKWQQCIEVSDKEGGL